MGKTTCKIPLEKRLSKKTFETIDTLTNDLKTMGINIKIVSESSRSFLEFEYDTNAFKRNAGRKKKTIPKNSSLKEMTNEEQAEWILTSSIEAITQELNISRATAFRRRAEAREHIEYSIVTLEKKSIQQD